MFSDGIASFEVEPPDPVVSMASRLSDGLIDHTDSKRDYEEDDVPTDLFSFITEELNGPLRFLAILPPGSTWSPGCKLAYHAYTGFMFIVMGLALPYAWYIEVLFGKVEGHLAIFLTIINAQPLLAWTFLCYYFRRSRHFTRTLIPLAQTYGCDSMRTRIRLNWRKSMWINFVVFAAYIVWLMQKIYSREETPPIALSLVFYALPITFMYRLMAPMIVPQIFSVLMQLHVRAIENWLSKHNRTTDCNMAELMFLFMKNKSVQNGSQNSWRFGFAISVTIPLVSLVLFLMAAKSDLGLVTDAWIFIPYTLHLVIQAISIFNCAAMLSKACDQVRECVLRRIALKEAFTNDTPGEVQAYVNFILIAFSPFKVMGVSVTVDLGAKILQLVILATAPLWKNVLESRIKDGSLVENASIGFFFITSCFLLLLTPK